MHLVQKVKEIWERDPRRLLVVIFGWAIVVVVALALISATVVTSPRVILAGEKQVATKPVVVRFLLPPNRQNIQINVEPKTDVSYQWSGGFFGRMSRTLLITPDTHWEVGKNYQVTINGVRGAVGFGKVTNHTASFTTQSLPKVSLVSSAGAKDVAINEPVTVELSSPSQGLAEFSFEMKPSAEFTVTNNDQSYLLSFTEGLDQGQKYQLTVYRQLIVADNQTGEIEKRLAKERVYQTSFTTVAPVLVESFSPQGQSVLPTSRKFKLVFSEAMDRSSVDAGLSISPAISGGWAWKDDQTIEFSSKANLPIDTKYSIKLKQGIKSQSGSFLDEDEALSFKTVGAIKVLSAKPANQSFAADLDTNIEITFDQPIVEASLGGKLAISPAVKFSYQLSGNKLVINPNSALDYYRTYFVTVASAVEAVYGKPLGSDYTLKFTTESKRVVLAIPLDYQDRALSCEAAALKMALNYRGANVTENDIMAIVGYDPTVKSGNVWGDPDVAFVGNIDGSQNSTGYGVHWGPIAKAAKNWRPAAAFSGWSAAKLAGAIEDGNPVVIWGVLGNAYYDPWKTPSNRTIAAWKGEHARTVIGYTGSASNPASFIINDPIVGRVTWSTATLLSNWGTFNNSGVVVY